MTPVNPSLAEPGPAGPGSFDLAAVNGKLAVLDGR